MRITDDGVATDSTMLAALHAFGAHKPHQFIVAVPVAPPEILVRSRPQCSHVECLLTPREFDTISQFYENFQQVEDEESVRLLRESRAAQTAVLHFGDRA